MAAIGIPNIGTAPNKSVPTATNPSSSGSLAFPVDLQKQPYWISFSFYSYSMPSLTDQNSLNLSDQGTIRLPLPNTMTDSQNVEYSTESLGLVAGLGVNGLSQGNYTQALAAGGAQAIGLGGDIQKRISMANVIGQTQGVVVNPFLTVMFKQPAFKQHQLGWKLSPSNQSESATLNSIINTFRGNMLPDKSGASGGTLLSYPNIVQISISVNSNQYFTYVFKPAVIQSLNVNFAPSNQPSFFGTTNAPTEVEISMQLLEIEYWLSSDWGIGTALNPVQNVINYLNTSLTPQGPSPMDIGTGIGFGSGA